MSFTQKEARECFNKARKALSSSGLTILIAPAAKQTGRILVVIPRRVGNAPQRNKLRRQLKALFYEEKLFEYPYDCIVLLRPEARVLTFAQLKELLLEGIRNADKLYNNPSLQF